MNPSVRPISTPSPSAPNNAPPLPDMCEAILTADSICELVADYRAHTQIMSVIGKPFPRTHVGDAVSFHLTDGADQLLRGDLAALQVRYHHDSSDWTDTIFRLASRFRLVRCRHSS